MTKKFFIKDEELKTLRNILGYSLKQCVELSGSDFSSVRLHHYERGVRNASLNTAVDLVVMFIKLYKHKRNHLLSQNAMTNLQKKQLELYLSILEDASKRINKNIDDTRFLLDSAQKKLKRG